MTDVRSTRLAALFDLALDLDAAGRRALLDRECGGDAALRAEVEALLAADDSDAARAFEQLTPAGAATMAPELRPGELVAGRYRIVRRIGEGGMGSVFEAEQLQPQRRVALKCLRAGFGSDAALRRFRREAELLGRLRHPGIAQILEAGFVDDAGRQPFFAMEYVQGLDLLEHARALPLPQRLELFAQVCDAVQHAHSLGIVHRDLKPANVLVDTAASPPRPKVLDFGVGRADAHEGGTLLTRTHEIVGTLAYLSPEQVAGGSAAADARSDVFALGVTLYQLVSGRLPLDLAGCSLPEAARRLQDEEPVRLDRLVTGARGDVATIVHKALAKEPARRYANAGELAADLRRHLRSEPIAGRPASAFYQWSRFARRNRVLVGGLAATFLALAAGLAVSLRFLHGERTQRAVAERRAADLRSLARELIFDVDGELAPVAGAVSARRRVVALGLRYAERLLLEAGDDPQLLTEVGIAFQKLAAVLGDPSKSNLGDLPGAAAALEQGIAALERAAAMPGGSREALDALLACRNLAAELHRARGEAAERDRAEQQAQAVGERMARDGDREGAELAAAMAAANRGRGHVDAGRHREAIADFEVYLASQRTRLGTGDPVAGRNVATILGYVARSHRALGDTAACRRALEEALQVARAFLRERPDDQNARRAVVEALRGLAIDEMLGKRPAGALPFLDDASALLAAAPADAADVNAVRTEAIVDYDRATALLDLQRATEAAPLLDAYRRRVEDLHLRSPGNATRARDVMLADQLGVKLHSQLGGRDALAATLQRALDACRAAIAEDAASELAWQDLDHTLRIGARAFADLAATAAGADAAALRQRAAELLDAELATLADMRARGFRAEWIGRRQREATAARGEVGDRPGGAR